MAVWITTVVFTCCYIGVICQIPVGIKQGIWVRIPKASATTLVKMRDTAFGHTRNVLLSLDLFALLFSTCTIYTHFIHHLMELLSTSFGRPVAQTANNISWDYKLTVSQTSRLLISNGGGNVIAHAITRPFK